jgi:hypothetical protein
MDSSDRCVSTGKPAPFSLILVAEFFLLRQRVAKRTPNPGDCLGVGKRIEIVLQGT